MMGIAASQSTRRRLNLADTEVEQELARAGGALASGADHGIVLAGNPLINHNGALAS